MSREVVELTLTRYIALLLHLKQINVWTDFPFLREPGTKQSWGLRLVGGLDVGTVLKVEKVRYFCLHILIFHLSLSPVSMLTMKQTGMETRRCDILLMTPHQSPTARVRDPEYHVVTREIDDRHFSKHEQRVSKNFSVSRCLAWLPRHARGAWWRGTCWWVLRTRWSPWWSTPRWRLTWMSWVSHVSNVTATHTRVK